MEPTIYIDTESLDSYIIERLVDEKEAPVRTKYVPLQGINIGVPPFYFDGNGVLIRDFWTLVEFLQERYPGEQLMPSDPSSRALMRQACKDILESQDLWPEIEEILKQGTPYLTGNEYTIVDLFAGAWMHFNGIEHCESQVVKDYYRRIGSKE